MGIYYKVPFKRPMLNLEKTLQKIAGLPRHKKIVMFGAGLHSIALFYRLKDSRVDIACFCDNDAGKVGKSYCGKPIISPDELIADKDNYYVLIGADCYADEITAGLTERGFPAERIASVRDIQNEEIIIPEEKLESTANLQEYTFECKRRGPVTPVISIFMYCYDTPGFYVRRAIESVLSQTFTDFELLIVDNAANAQNKAIIADYKQRDDRIQVLTMRRNIREAREDIALVNEWFLEKVTGKYFCKLDSDDYLAPTFLERVYHAAEGHDADLVSANLLWYHEDLARFRWCSTLDQNEIMLSGSSDIADAIVENVMQFASKQCKLYRTDKLLHFYLYEYSIPDSIIGAVPKLEKAVIVKDFLCFYTVRIGSVSTTVNITTDMEMSEYGVVKRIRNGFLSVLTQCNCLTEKNAYIVNQNYLNHICQQVLPHLCIAEDARAVCQIVEIMLEDLHAAEDLCAFPEYDGILAKLMSIMQAKGG